VPDANMVYLSEVRPRPPRARRPPPCGRRPWERALARRATCAADFAGRGVARAHAGLGHEGDDGCVERSNDRSAGAPAPARLPPARTPPRGPATRGGAALAGARRPRARPGGCRCVLRGHLRAQIPNPTGLAAFPDANDGRLFIACPDESAIFVLRTRTGGASRLDLSGLEPPTDLAIDPGGVYLYRCAALQPPAPCSTVQHPTQWNPLHTPQHPAPCEALYPATPCTL